MWTAPTLRECLFSLSEDGHARAVVDLEGVDFLDSTALGVLVGAHKRFVQRGGGLVRVCTMPRIMRVLEVTGLSRVFEVHPSVGEAVGRS